MTLTELEAMTEDVLTCAEIAPVLMVNPQSIRLQAAESGAARLPCYLHREQGADTERRLHQLYERI